MTQVYDFVSEPDTMRVRIEDGRAFVQVTEATTIIGPPSVVLAELERIADALSMNLALFDPDDEVCDYPYISEFRGECGRTRRGHAFAGHDFVPSGRYVA